MILKNKRILTRKVLSVLFFFIIISASSQQRRDAISKKTFLEKLWGEKLEDGIIFMPLGSHTTAPDVFDVLYTGFSYKNVELAVFKNSYRDWTMILLYKRVWYLSESLYFTGGAGLIYGYKGKLQEIEGIPFKESVLFSGDINPVVGLDVDYRISKKISIHASITPLVVIYGIKYYL